jgi:ribbon-helix-helix CopG family protein
MHDEPITTPISLPPALYTAVDDLARKMDVDVEDVVRIALRNYLFPTM